LEVADLYAFVTRRALSGNQDANKQFMELFEIINPAHLETHLNPDPKWQKGMITKPAKNAPLGRAGMNGSPWRSGGKFLLGLQSPAWKDGALY
jgi:hypothetical protein